VLLFQVGSGPRTCCIAVVCRLQTDDGTGSAREQVAVRDIKAPQNAPKESNFRYL